MGTDYNIVCRHCEIARDLSRTVGRALQYAAQDPDNQIKSITLTLHNDANEMEITSDLFTPVCEQCVRSAIRDTLDDQIEDGGDYSTALAELGFGLGGIPGTVLAFVIQHTHGSDYPLLVDDGFGITYRIIRDHWKRIW